MKFCISTLLHITNQKTLVKLNEITLVEKIGVGRNFCVRSYAGSIKKFRVSQLKSDNLQYDTLVRWTDGTNDSLTKRLTFQLFFS